MLAASCWWGLTIRTLTPARPLSCRCTALRRGGWQDIYSDSMRDGEWWASVNEDAPEELITLAPGQNLIRVTMVNAHPQSKVRLLYRETYRAGH